MKTAVSKLDRIRFRAWAIWDMEIMLHYDFLHMRLERFWHRKLKRDWKE